MKRLSAIGLVFAAVVGAGCGGSSKPAPPVRLTVDGPPDQQTLRANTVNVHGIVSPTTSTVLVEGKDVPVANGRFSADVALLPGTNLIDIVAGAPGGARPAMVALRVRRLVTVSIPDLTGYTPNDAKDALAALGLKADIQRASGLLEFLLPESARVCQTQPGPGTSVNPGTTVTVYAAKQC